MRKLIVSLLVIMLSASFAWSADQPNITAQLTAQRVSKTGQGKEVLSPADTAKPGEVIEYRIVYKNSGKAMARGLQGVLPIPLEMEFIPGSAVPADVSASLDGKSFSKIPLQRKVKLADGSIVVREVPVAEYRSLRWNLNGLAPGDQITAKARMRIKNDLRGPVAITPDSKNK
jgi:uncharacterized repeat protein (TIGR01451 family)